ncbi:CRISPR-associated endonuclease Cas1 [Eubacterium ruminantium]|nr:CRISPR-associated endonuclease Cas1 [Eubacterium ruminantium]
MSWRTVVISQNAKLDYQIGYLVVRGRETVKVHIDEIGMLIIENTAVSFTAYLLSELVKKKIKVIFCDEKRNPSSELVSYYGSHDTSAKIRKQMEWTDQSKEEIWTAIVSEKISKQAALLKYLGKSESELLFQYIKEIELGDKTNREGHAAKVYFNALFGKSFTRSDENSINAALNYGYSLILSAVAREIVSNGYITQIGIFHDNMFNQFNLASDLMEPFRPIVDKKVFESQFEKFEKEEKHYMLELLQSEITVSGKKEYLLNAIKIYVRSVFDAINEKDISLIRFYTDELQIYESSGFI